MCTGVLSPIEVCGAGRIASSNRAVAHEATAVDGGGRGTPDHKADVASRKVMPLRIHAAKLQRARRWKVEGVERRLPTHAEGKGLVE
jgi:hypothetical protein